MKRNQKWFHNKKHSENADTSTSETMTRDYELGLNVYSHMLMTLHLTKSFSSFAIPLIQIIKSYKKIHSFHIFNTHTQKKKKRFRSSTLKIISFFPPFLKLISSKISYINFIVILDISSVHQLTHSLTYSLTSFVPP